MDRGERKETVGECPSPVTKYSGPSSFDRLDIRKQLGLRPNILVLTYDQSLELRPECRSRPLELRPAWRL
jgi:hypothetical protein